VVCPLCLEAFRLDEPDGLTVEHPVPSTLGGRVTTLTCKACNNSHGSVLDRHLVDAQKALDGLEGAAPIEGTWRRLEGRVSLQVRPPVGLEGDQVELRIVGLQSNPVAVAAIGDGLRDGAILQNDIEIELDFKLTPEQYWRAAVRAAYLAVFCDRQYEYACTTGAEQPRDVINGKAQARPTVIMEAFPDREVPRCILVIPLADCFAVLLRLRSKRTRHLVVWLPGESGCRWTDLEALYPHAPRLRIQTTPDGWTEPLHIYLDYDPVSEMIAGRRLWRSFLRLPSSRHPSLY